MRSIQTKIVVLFLLGVVLTATLIGLAGSFHTADILVNSAERRMLLLLERSTLQMDTALAGIEDSVDTVGAYITREVEETPTLNEDVVRDLFLNDIGRIALNHARGVQGARAIYVSLDYRALGLSAPCGLYYVYSEEDGNFTSAPLTDVYEYGEDADEVSWYYRAKEAGKGVWFDGYHNRELGIYIATYSVPIYLDGSFIGVVGIDVESSYIAEVARQIVAYETGFASLLTRENTVFYHPAYAPGDSISGNEEAYPEIAEAITNENVASGIYPYRIDGQERYLAFSLLKNGMKLCIVAPRGEVFAEYNTMLLSNILITVLLTVFWAYFAYLMARKIAKPIKQLNNAARDMVEGNLDTVITPTTRDEIGELTLNLNRARERLKLHISDLHDEAFRDGMTGVANKSAYHLAVGQLNERIAAKRESVSFVVALFDVNRLKVTNDFFGHTMGDEMLRAIALHLKSGFDPQHVFRIGGDEFLVLVESKNTESTIALIERCAAKLETLTLPDHPDIHISCAVGITAFQPERDKEFSDTFARCDRLMYRNKGESKRLATWQEGGKGVKQIQLEKFLQFLSILSQSTEDYLYLYDIESDKSYFFGEIAAKYRIPCENNACITLDQMTEAIHPADRATFTADVNKVLDQETAVHLANFRLITHDGMPTWVSSRGHTIMNDGRPFLLIGRISDQALRPWYSPITGLFNRQKFLRDMQSETPPAFTKFMLLDIDDLSTINLKKGRDTGDSLLCLLARTLEELFPTHTVYHMEKDRFAVLFEEGENDEITSCFERIVSALDGRLNVSAAVVPYEKGLYTDANNVYEYAIQLLKETSKKKGGAISFFSQEDFERRATSIELLEELKGSILHDFDSFYVHYQPLVSALDYTVVGAEALLRYESKARGQIRPAEIIPLLERTNLINKVGLWILERALSQCCIWRSMLPTFRIAVNFSPVQLKENDVADRIIALLAKYNLPGDALTIELTESVQMEMSEALAITFERFRSVGIRIALDDFGTGYANLAYLKQIHADNIKVDRVFIKDIKDSSYNYAVISNILEIAKANSFEVCLEGIETLDELAVLCDLGAQTLQGYLFGKPTDATDFEARFIRDFTPESWGFLADLGKLQENKHLVRFDPKAILSQVNVGLWVIRIDENAGTCELFADSRMRGLLGADPDMTPAECYSFWYSRVKEGHTEVVNAMVEAMRTTGKIRQAEYPWLHPTLGEFTVRCTGKCVHNEDGILLYEGFHRNISEAGTPYTKSTMEI